MANGNFLKSDSEGFLVGSPIDVGQLMDKWTDIYDEVHEIKGLLLSQSNTLKKVASQQATGTHGNRRARRTETETATPKTRRTQAGKSARPTDVGGNGATAGGKTARERKKANSEISTATEAGVKKAVASTSRKRDNETAKKTAKEIKAVLPKVRRRGLQSPFDSADGDGNTPTKTARARRNSGSAGKDTGNGRDEKGRFVSRADAEGVLFSSSIGVGRFARKIGEAVSEATNGMEEADPAVAAVKEVATPITRGFQVLQGFGQDTEKTWLKRIFGSLKDFRKEESTFNKTADKRLKKIERKDSGGKSTGFLGTLKNLLAGFTAFGSRLIKSITSGALLKGIFGGGLLGKAGGMLARKVPFLAALFEGVKGIFGAWESENDSRLTRGEKDKRTGKALGGASGSIGGMLGGAKLGAAIGTAIAPGIGSAVGSVIGGMAGLFFGDKAGQILGEKMGEFVTWIRSVDFAGLWQNGIDSVREKFNTATEYFTQKWDEVKGGFENASQFCREKWQEITDKWSGVKEWFDSLFEPVREKWEELSGKVEGFFKPFLEIADTVKKWFGSKEL